MRVSDASLTDVSDLVRLVNAAYRAPEGAPGWTDERQLLEGTRVDAETLERQFDGGRFIVLREEPLGRIIGCARISLDDDAWALSMIAVDPACQNRGIGAALLDVAERQAKAAAARRLRLTVIQLRGSLIAWYERRGFRRTGATLPFPYDDPRVGRPLRADLALIVLEKTLADGP